MAKEWYVPLGEQGCNGDRIYDDGGHNDFEDDTRFEVDEGDHVIEDEARFEDDDDLCEEEEKFECPNNFFEAVKRLKNLLVAVEFECAGCCKKAIGILRCVEPDFIELFRPPHELVQVQMFCPGSDCATTECACIAVIRFEKIISVEQVAEQQCPHKRPHDKRPHDKCPHKKHHDKK